MKTDDLIEILAVEAGPVRPARPGARVALAAAAGAATALALMLIMLGWSPLPDVQAQPWFWVKAGYAAALASSAALLVLRLARPGAQWRTVAPAIAVIVSVMLLLGLLELLQLPKEQRLGAWRGPTWTVCSLRILLLSAPITLLVLAAVRTLAPTDPTRAGAAAGVLAGSLAAGVYALHCPGHGLAFVALWYSIGITLAAASGAMAGRIVLRW
jgi:hypothetical protein